MKPQPRLLLHPVFLTSLFVLLVNDFFLKSAFTGELTGKISDFSGLFVFAVFLISIFPSHRKAIIVLVALFFGWWKSPASSFLLVFLNEKLHLPVHRVIDYTDLFALAVLPVAYRIKEPAYRLNWWRRAAMAASCIVSFFAFCATTMAPRPLYDTYNENIVYYMESYSTALTKTDVLQRLDNAQKGYTLANDKFYRVNPHEKFYQRTRTGTDTTTAWAPVPNNTDTALYVRKDELEYYSIPEHIMDNDTLRNLEVRIYTNPRKKKRPTTVELVSYEIREKGLRWTYMDEKRQKEFKKYFKKLFTP